MACDVASHGSPIARVGNSIHLVEPSSSPPNGAEVSGLSRGRKTLLQPARRRGSVRAGSHVSELNPGPHRQKESIKAEKHPKAGTAREWVVGLLNYWIMQRSLAYLPFGARPMQSLPR